MSKEKKVDKIDCYHKWHPISVDTKNEYIFYKCSFCGEVCWDEINYLEWIGNMRNEYDKD